MRIESPIRKRIGGGRHLFTVGGIAVALLIGGCASVPMAEKGAELEAKRFEPVADRAKVYIFRRDRLFAKAVAFDVFLDGRVIASTVSGSFCAVLVLPGEYVLSSQYYGGARQLKIDAVAGGVYFVEQIPRGSMTGPFTELTIADEQGARREIIKAGLVKSIF